MFCSKCGTQFSESDQFCPKCGKENINYVGENQKYSESSPFDDQRNQDRIIDGDKKVSKKKKWIIPVVVTGIVIVVGTLLAVFLVINGTIAFSTSNSKVSYSSYGISGYLGKDGGIYFIESGEVKSFDGKFVSGRSTPDHTKYVVLAENGSLQLYELQEEAYVPTIISDKVESILAVSNDGCFYTTGSNSHLFFFNFIEKASVDTLLEDCSFEFSRNKNTVIGISDSGEIKKFSVGDSSAKNLCNAEGEIEICCIADNGANLVWAVKDGNSFGIYTLKNGAPERIGKITNSEKYSYVYGFYYNDDKSFVIYSDGSTQMILSQNGEIKQLALPGVKGIGRFYDQNGNYMDSDDDYIAEPYLIIRKTKVSSTGGLYRLTKNGNFVLEVDDIKLESSWDYLANPYYIRNGSVYFINKEGDLYKKQLGEGNQIVLITTDVKALYIPDQGEYIYVAKAGSLYYIVASDKDAKLNMIWSKLSDKDTIALTDKSEVLYFISDIQEISDSYRTKGTVYRFVVGSEPKEFAQNIMYIQRGDQKNVSADHPIFEQYISHKDYDYVINVGTYLDGEYKELIQSAVD